MTTDDKSRDKKFFPNDKREAAKISSSSGKIDKDEYLTGKEILPPDQSRLIKKLKFIYSPLVKVFQKQIKIIEY